MLILSHVLEKRHVDLVAVSKPSEFFHLVLHISVLHSESLVAEADALALLGCLLEVKPSAGLECNCEVIIHGIIEIFAFLCLHSLSNEPLCESLGRRLHICHLIINEGGHDVAMCLAVVESSNVLQRRWYHLQEILLVHVIDEHLR